MKRFELVFIYLMSLLLLVCLFFGAIILGFNALNMIVNGASEVCITSGVIYNNYVEGTGEFEE